MRDALEGVLGDEALDSEPGEVVPEEPEPENEAERVAQLETAVQAMRERIAAEEARAKRLEAAVHGLQMCAEAAPDVLKAWLESLGEDAIDGAIALEGEAQDAREEKRIRAGAEGMARRNPARLARIVNELLARAEAEA